MIRAIIQDISVIVDNLKTKHEFKGLVFHLDAEVKQYLHNAFLDNRIDDYICNISQGPDRIHLKIQIREDQTHDWDHLGWTIDPPHIAPNANDSYDRAMRGI